MIVRSTSARLASIVTLAMLTGCSTTGWRAQEIDGSSQPAFETSVTSLQERLAPRRRAEFETSLAIVWLRQNSVGAGDADSDGSIDVNEMRALQQAAEDVFADVRRGVFAFAEHEASGADYARQLDGLTYDGVIDLAAATPGDVFLNAVRDEKLLIQCKGWRQVPGKQNTWTNERFPSAVISRRCRARR
jgi:hypothetical protein